MKIFDLTGKVALVTGSSQGIGLALAEGLAEAGAKIILNGRNEKKLKDAANHLKKNFKSISILQFDVTDHSIVTQKINEHYDTGENIDILVNNAGMQYRAPLEDFPPEQFELLMKTNVSSIFNVGQAVAKYMIKEGKGKIINIASVQTALARPGIAPYTTTKGAVSNLTKGMATDWAPKGLQVNAIAPGYFNTPLNAALVADPDFSAWLKKRTPAGRWGEVKELIGACIFLAAPSSSFVNGQTIFVDGGITASL
ncbi:MAG: SDR family oxidoreductase [Paracoccaceae bacterium]|nr:SDR family oxidoreductase [Paracoccaceae bacterium]